MRLERVRRARFRKTMRLQTAAVAQLLRHGAHYRQSPAEKASSAETRSVAVRFLVRLPGADDSVLSTHIARIAISIPKRIIRAAVCRNTFKRWIREVFRQHDIRVYPVDLLVSLKHKIDVKSPSASTRLCAEVHRTFNDILAQTKPVARGAG